MKRTIHGLAATLLLILPLAVSGDQSATCTMDDKEHKAHYRCPDGYEVNYAGAGTKVCTGGCYKKGNSASLRASIQSLASARGLKVTPMNSTEYDRKLNDVMQGYFVDIPTDKGMMTVCSPLNGRCRERK